MTWQLTTIVSAAVAGAERGGLDAAIELDLEHGGWRAAGDEIPPIYAERMRETRSPERGMARRLNVQDSDATLVVALSREVDGVAAFISNTAKRTRKPYMQVVLPAAGNSQMPEDVAEAIRAWIRDERIGILHVAGPTEAEVPGIQQVTHDVLVWVFEDEVAERSIERVAREVAAAGGQPDALAINPANVDAAVAAGLEVTVVPWIPDPWPTERVRSFTNFSAMVDRDYGGYGVHAPPRVTSVTAHWTEGPPERSPRCAWWVERIKRGWRGNRRTRSMGYHESAEYFGVWIWEWLNVLSPLLDETARRKHGGPR